jgi:hypothetical protein
MPRPTQRFNFAAVVLIAIAMACSSVGCGSSEFDPSSKVGSVRVLASRSDKPYAAPGATVTVEVLAYDGRKTRPEPMKIYWLPFLCKNPIQDLYYACFTQLSGGGMMMAPNPAVAFLKPGVDLTPFLPSGAKYAVTLPTDIVTSHPVVPGADVPYGLGIVFNIACAGHVELIERDPGNPQAVPFGCFDAAKNRLGPDDYVIGFSRIYGYDTRTNANPEITEAHQEGAKIDLHDGIIVDHCTSKPKDTTGAAATAAEMACPKIKLDIVVPESSQEPNESDHGPDGSIRKEQIWAAYYTTLGKLGSDARLLYDAVSGKVPGSENDYQAPMEAGEGKIWIVVHDNRGGANWLELPLHVK